MTEKKTGLELLRSPFEPHQISKLPKPTKKQTEDVKNDYKKGIRCSLCSSWHHPDVVHLDYVGHAALTDRLLDTDPLWTWEPVAYGPDGLPAFDKTGGLWIKLTVCGHSRLGYGHAKGGDSKEPGAREKEVIGDALRNAAMRFGAALDLWHKGDLRGDDEDKTETPAKTLPPPGWGKEAMKEKSKEPIEEYRDNVKTFIHKTTGNPKVTLPPNTTMPINGQMYQNLILKVKDLEAGWQKVEAYTKTNFAKSPKLLTIQEYEQVMSIITAGAL